MMDADKLALAIKAVEEGLQDTERDLPPDKKAALFMAAYELINEDERRSEKMDNGELYLEQSEFNQRVVAVVEALNLVPIGQAEAILKEASAVVKDSALVDASGDRFNAIKREYLGERS